MKRWVTAAILVITCCAATTNSVGQTRVLSLQECIKIAVGVSTTVGIYHEQLRSARQDVLASYGRFLPNATLNFTGGRNYLGPTSTIFLDAQGRPVEPEGSDFENYSFSLSTNMLLYDFGVSKNSLHESRRNSEAAEHDLRYQKDVVVAIVIRAYYDLVRKQRLHEVQLEAVKAAKRNLEQVEAFYNIGSSTRADVLQAKVRLGNTNLELITAVNDEELAWVRLGNLLNFPLDEQFEVDTSLNVTRIDLDIDEEIAYMLEHRPDLLAARRRVRAAKHGVVAATNARLPTLGAGFRYSWNDRQFPDNGNVFRKDYSWGIGVSLDFNIFDRFATKTSSEQAKARQRISEYNLKQAKLDAILEVEQLFLVMKQAGERMDVAKEQVAQAEENLRLAEERYRVGAGTILETIEAGANMTAAQASLIEASCDYLIAQADLRRATGRVDGAE